MRYRRMMCPTMPLLTIPRERGSPVILGYAILAWYAQAQSCAGSTAVNLSTAIR